VCVKCQLRSRSSNPARVTQGARRSRKYLDVVRNFIPSLAHTIFFVQIACTVCDRLVKKTAYDTNLQP